MTIADINKILSQLAANPTRENVLDLSFALLQWMNIEANKVIRKKFECIVFTKEVGYFSKINRTYFSYTTTNNRNKKIKIYQERKFR